jgi:hypothetical protein
MKKNLLSVVLVVLLMTVFVSVPSADDITFSEFKTVISDLSVTG